MQSTASLRSKRFRLVSEQRKTEERDSRFWPREKSNKSQKMKVGGGGGGGEGMKLRHDRPSERFSKSRGLSASVSFLSSPRLPALLLTPFSARSLTLVPRSLLLNRTESLATQASLLRACDTQRPALATRRSLTARSRS